jgi:hypothetical protein
MYVLKWRFTSYIAPEKLLNYPCNPSRHHRHLASAQAYITEYSNPGVVHLCTFDATRSLIGCVDSGATLLDRPGGITLANGYVKTFTHKIDSRITMRLTRVAFGFCHRYAYMTNFGNNEVTVCTRNADDNTLTGCTLTANDLSRPNGIVIVGNWAYIGTYLTPPDKSVMRCAVSGATLSGCVDAVR